MAFPTIVAATKIDRNVVDNTLRSPSDAGYVQTRPRTTRQIYEFDVAMILNQTDLALLLAHDASVTGSTIFTWTNTEEDVTYNVRYVNRVRYTRSPDQKGYWNVSFKLQSV